MYTLTQMTNILKRRLRQLTTDGSASSETEKAFAFGNQAIWDAINAGRSAISVNLRTSIWSRQMGVITTQSNVMDYSLDTSVKKIHNVLYNTASDGDRETASAEALNVNDMNGEQALIDDPYQTPSGTEPYYRLANKGIRLIVSEDGTVTASKYVRIEFDGDLDNLTAATDNSYVSDEIDELSMDWAMAILLESIDLQRATMYKNIFHEKVSALNQIDIRS